MEKVEKESKEVKMKIVSKPENKDSSENPQNKKLTYEQLADVANQLNNQVKQLYMELQQTNMTNIFKRLDYLFKVIENRDAFVGSPYFVTACIKEIIQGMTVTVKKENKENKKEESKKENIKEDNPIEDASGDTVNEK